MWLYRKRCGDASDVVSFFDFAFSPQGYIDVVFLKPAGLLGFDRVNEHDATANHEEVEQPTLSAARLRA
jgi:hypothetical protein